MARVTLWALLFLACGASAAQTDTDWPREYSNDNGKLLLYQPQVTSWDDFARLEARMAVAFASAGTEAPHLGAVRISAKTDTNMEDHLVRVYDIAIEEGSYPALDDERAARLSGKVDELLPDETIVELERIVASLDRYESASREPAFKVDPPTIFVGTTPTILVLLDGPPLWSPIEKSDLKFAVNTNWDLFKFEGWHYLRNEDVWLKAITLGGPWSPAGKLPTPFKKLPKKDPNWTEVRESLPGTKIEQGDVPRVLVSEAPAELILLDGEPMLSLVEGSGLLWVNNTESDLFLHAETRTFYYLVSGRWFRAANLDGSWEFASLDLPEDFARIPVSHPRARVRAAVPGTPEADEAVLLAQIPQKATVRRDAAKPDVHYNGEPEFVPVEGTSMYYAKNTPNDVIRVGDMYYLCFQGVWFASTKPSGPWEVADEVPDEVYEIPPSSPMHHVTYVHVYDSSPDYVVTGYTSGYVGIYVSFGCAWYGTGWYYSPYYYWGPYYPIYYPYPYSYGTSAWYNPHTGSYGRSTYAYGPYGGWGRGAAYNPSTGTYGRGGVAYGPYQAGGWAQAYNPRTGTSAGTYQRATPYEHWGESVVRRGDDWVHSGHYSNERGTVAGIETSEGGRAVGFSGDEGRGFVGKDKDNNLYAGRDGNVYRRDEGGWSKYEGGDWSPVERPEGDRPTREGSGTRENGDGIGATRPEGSASDRGGSPEGTARDRARSERGQGGTAGDRTGSGPTPSDRAGAGGTHRDRTYEQLERDRRARERGSTRARDSSTWRSSPGRGSYGGSRGGYRGGGGRGRRR